MKAAYILSFLASAVSASKFLQFPISASCTASDKSVTTFTKAELEKIAANSISSKTARLEDIFGVANTATSHCNSIVRPLYENPLYSTAVGRSGVILFGFYSKRDEFVYCGSIEGLPTADGYGSGCAEQF